MVSELEICDVMSEQWNCLGFAQPGGIGTFAQNLPSGEREIYHFYCDKNDEITTIYKRPDGNTFDMNSSEMFFETSLSICEKIAVLTQGQVYYLSFLPDGGDIRKLARISHV